MKVIKVINSLDFGGIEKVFEIVAKYHKHDRYELIFVALGEGGKAEEFIRSLGFRVIVLHGKTRIPNLGLIRKLMALFKEERPGVVHTCGAEGNFHGLLAAWLTGVPVRIGEEIGMPSHSSVAKRVFKFVYSRSTYVVVVASAVLDYLIQAKEVTREKTRLIYNPVDLDHYIETPREPDSNYITLLSVCRLHPIKNLDTLILCTKELINEFPALRLWLVGDGPIRQELEQLVRVQGLQSSVTFFGFQQDPQKYLSQADFFVLPSLSEGHPVSLVEAMIAGVPSLVTKVGGASEIIVHGESGWLLDPLDKSQMIRAMKEAVSCKPEKLQKVTAKAKAYALENFSPDSYFEKLNELYSHAKK